MPDSAARTRGAVRAPDLTRDDPPTLKRVLVAALVFRLIIAPWSAHGGDANTFRAWALRLADVGPSRFWNDKYWCDYLPGYLYALWGLGEVIEHVPAELQFTVTAGVKVRAFVQVASLKLPSIAADLAIGWILWHIGRRGARARGADESAAEDKGRWLAVLFLFNPAVFGNSSIWGQVDSFHALGLVGGLALLVQRRALAAAVVLGVASAVKPHTAVVLPLAAAYALVAGMGVLRTLACGALAAAVFAASFIPFNPGSLASLPEFIEGRIHETMGQYGCASVNAMNFWYLIGANWHPDEGLLLGLVSMQRVGQALTIGMVLAAIAWMIRRRRTVGEGAVWEAAALIYLGLFLFVTRAHERHGFPYFPMALAAAATSSAVLAPYVVVSLTTVINLGLSWRYLLPGHHAAELCPPVLGALVCLLNLAALAWTWMAFTASGARRTAAVVAWFRGLLSDEAETAEAGSDPGMRVVEVIPPARAHVPKAGWWLLAIVVFALGIRLVRLNSPPERYFDEVYHPYTAERWLKGDTDAWLWSTHAPDPGCAYEWTHPPLAKEFMWASMRVFGIHPWAWRLPSALLGVVCIVLIYRIAGVLFESERIALSAAAFAALDALPLVMSRIGMNDTYFVAFMLTAVLAALRHKTVWAALAAGAAAACKWTALFLLPLLALIHLFWARPGERWNVKRWCQRGLAYGLLVPGMYAASYIPFFASGFSVDQFIHLQKQMWWYHTGLKATHGFSSPAIGWPVTYKSVWCHTRRFEPAGVAAASSEPTMRGASAQSPQRPSPQPAASSKGVQVANIYAAGNPAIWLPGVAALLFAGKRIWRARRKPVGDGIKTCTRCGYRLKGLTKPRCPECGLPVAQMAGAVWQRRMARALVIVLAGYLVFWAPWLFSPRIMFLYHYLPSLWFLYMALAWAVWELEPRASGMRFMAGLAGAVLIVLYPYLTAVPMPIYLTPGNWLGF